MEYTTGARCKGMLVVAVVVAMLASGAVAQSAWQVENIAPAGGLRAAPALVFDGQDRAQIVYGDSSGLYHARGNQPGATPGWAPAGQPIYSVGPYGQQLSLAASGNSVYLASSGYPGGYPRNFIATYDGMAWTQDLTFPSNSLSFAGVATNAAGQAHWLASTSSSISPADPGRGITTAGTYLLSSTSPTEQAVKVTSQAFPPFRSTTEAALHMGGQMLFDTSGNLHTVQFSEDGAGTLTYIKGQPAGPFTVMDNLDQGWEVKLGQPSLALDSAGNPHIAYTQQWPNYGVKHLAWNGTGWDSEWIDQGGSITGYLGTFPDMIIDQAGQMHVIYADLLNGLLKHAMRTGGSWQIETIDQIGTQAGSGLMNGALAAAMDSRGGIGVAYWSGQAGQMKYAYLVPEPATMALLIAAGGLFLRRRRA